MFAIYLTDVQKNVQFKDYPGEHPVKFIQKIKRNKAVKEAIEKTLKKEVKKLL